MSGDTGQFSLEHLRKMKEGVKLFNAGQYWLCHEELEDHWLEDTHDPNRYVYWVVIQVATSLLHASDGNLAGAKGMIEKAKEKVLQCEKQRLESDIMMKFLSWKRFKKLVKEVPMEPELDDFKALLAFKFSQPEKWEQHLSKWESEK